MKTSVRRSCQQAIRALAAGLIFLSGPAGVAKADEVPAAPPEPAYGFEQPWKLTLGLYRTADVSSVDLNLRRNLGAFNLWLGGYHENAGDSVVRVGADWTLKSDWLRVTPAFAYATNGFFGGQVYAEIGREAFLIGGYSQTNEKDYFNLTFDPNESAQVGAGIQIDARDRLTASTTFDVRLGTGQQNSHLVYRRYTSQGHRLTLDLSYKSGYADDGSYLRGSGVQVTYDGPRLFVRAAWDQYVNFTEQTMLRLGGGFRF